MIDIAIIGAGPAGLTAAIYAARAGMQTAVFEPLLVGGQLTSIDLLENYPGFPDGVNGYEIALALKAQAERFGATIIAEEVVKIAGQPSSGYVVETNAGTHDARTVILATGAKPRKLPLPGVLELEGRGVSYCATCDGNFFRGKTVMVVGGGNTAAADAIYLSRLASRVILVHRRNTLRATPVYHRQLAELENVEFVWNATVRALHGEDGKLAAAQIEHLADGSLETVPVDGVFVAVGTQPNTELLAGALPLDGCRCGAYHYVLILFN